ncbi:hypothetical protein [Cyanobium sp. N5-Cardenillas]|uniref:hypothetical protein n=1 Tax=Cyanobium sp. N5-Cardenillas TaxID=2823720 RepID=UPI0020CEEA31|nr:hypothetical protein [Cyanobium sp. N5-Cardenillas]MCP9786015.1 hypothetical protein [Cyanobium sp. N5-Cardenillas]
MTKLNVYKSALEALLVHLADPDDRESQNKAEDALDHALIWAKMDQEDEQTRLAKEQESWGYARTMLNTWNPEEAEHRTWPGAI